MFNVGDVVFYSTTGVCEVVSIGEPALKGLPTHVDYYTLQPLSKNHREMIYVPVRAGQVNTETEYVLNTFGQSVPVFMNAIRTQVCDINIRRIAPISSDFSLNSTSAS